LKTKNKVDVEKTKKIVSIVVIVLLALIIVSGSFYSIREEEQAVVCTFGSPQAVTTPGLHFKIPFIQTVDKVSTTIKVRKR
jgi:membrane protease subunit HflK